MTDEETVKKMMKAHVFVIPSTMHLPSALKSRGGSIHGIDQRALGPLSCPGVSIGSSGSWDWDWNGGARSAMRLPQGLAATSLPVSF